MKENLCKWIKNEIENGSLHFAHETVTNDGIIFKNLDDICEIRKTVPRTKPYFSDIIKISNDHRNPKVYFQIPLGNVKNVITEFMGTRF